MAISTAPGMKACMLFLLVLAYFAFEVCA